MNFQGSVEKTEITITNHLTVLTWSLVFNEEKLQSFFKGVFINIEFYLHSANKTYKY